MKVILLNGSPHKEGCTDRALTETETTLIKEGIECEKIQIPQNTQGCRACGYCKKTGNGCVFGNEDGLNTIIEKIKTSDGLIIGSPVYYSNVNGIVRAFADRLFYAGSAYGGENIFKGKVGACIVNCRRGGASAAFEEMNQYFLISNMIVPGSQYWNQTHGRTREQTELDEEGLQTMRTLARNTAWILKCIRAGKDIGINFPEHENVLRTDFIH